MTVSPFAQGNEISLQCMGASTDESWLEGDAGGGVGLAVEDRAQSGTRWRVHDNKDGTFRLLCLAPSQTKQWLRGFPSDATVDIGPPTDAASWMGTWDEIDGSTLECSVLGDWTWLDGEALSGKPGLSADGGNVHSTARWRVVSYGILID